MSPAHAPIDLPPRRIHAQQVADYAQLTRDANPIHLDEAFAVSRALGGTIVHGTLLIAPVWQALVARFGKAVLTDAQVQCKFIRPVRVGSVVHIRGECIASEPQVTQYSFAVRAGGAELHAVVDVRFPSR